MSVMRVLSTWSNVTFVRESNRPDWKWGTTLQASGNGRGTHISTKAFGTDASKGASPGAHMLLDLAHARPFQGTKRLYLTSKQRLHHARAPSLALPLPKTAAARSVSLHGPCHPQSHPDTTLACVLSAHSPPPAACRAQPTPGTRTPGWVTAQRQDLQQSGIRHKVEARELCALGLQVCAQRLLAQLQLLEKVRQHVLHQLIPIAPVDVHTKGSFV